MSEVNEANNESHAIAIIGMAGCFPGASNVDQYWKNISSGLESITFFTDTELLAAGIDPQLLKNPRYVKAKGVLPDVELFDADFFGYTPQEAEIIDPQHRLFLACAWEALEHAGYNSETYSGLIGVFGGCGTNTYLLNNVLTSPALRQSLDEYQLLLGNDKDFLTTRVSYKLNLTGPSMSIQTACSTSLAAVHVACQNLLDYHCDMALAGGVCLTLPMQAGYLYEEGKIFSPDGHCRAFDSQAQGSVPGNGAGVVVLKRLSDALADRDFIHGVIRGSAIGNDGNLKAGYTTPGLSGQVEAVALALAAAGIEPEAVTYLETNGTGTPVGDPIEIEALTQVFRESTAEKNFCAIGSVKSNIGHTSAAAGVAALIKTVQALKHKQLPPSLHYTVPNPLIDFANSPFYVNTTLTEWKSDGMPRRAGVSAFGVGGTNVHVILEEPLLLNKSSIPTRAAQLLVFSAKTKTALKTQLQNFLNYLTALTGELRSAVHLADIAYTLAVGRKPFTHRAVILCRTVDEAIHHLSLLINSSLDKPVANNDDNSDKELVETAKLWLAGNVIDWESFYSRELRGRMPLPTYPFEGKRHWLAEPAQAY